MVTFLFPSDMCLSRGTKRKLTQRTLLQMNFCLPSKVQICSSEKEQSENNSLLINHYERIVRNGVHVLHNFDGCEENDSTSTLSESLLNSKSVTNKDSLSESSICDDNTDENIDMFSLSRKNETSDDDMAIMPNDIAGVILETFIVGRKYSGEKEINFGERISLVRDPRNVKDPNAVKVKVHLHTYIFIYIFYFNLYFLSFYFHISSILIGRHCIIFFF